MSSGSSNLQIAGAECEESDPLTTRQCVPRSAHCVPPFHTAVCTTQHTDHMYHAHTSACGTCTTMMCDGADWYIRPVFLGPASAPQYLFTIQHLDGSTLDKENQEPTISGIKYPIFLATEYLIDALKVNQG